MGNRNGGWQANVEYFDDYVIKTPKTEDEILETVAKYLRHIDKMEELEERVLNMQRDWQTSLEIVRQRRIPEGMLGHIEILDDGKIKQRRVNVLQDVWNELYLSGRELEMRMIVDKSLDFVIELWKYGVFDKTFKIGYEYGLMDGNVMLIDFGELSEDKNILKKGIINKKWISKMEKYSHPEVAKYFNCQAEKKLTLEALDENWRKYLR